MIRTVFITIALFSAVIAKGQIYFPSYPEIVRAFFLQYNSSNEAEKWITFAKKKEGWFIQKINQLESDLLLSEERFWTPASGYSHELKNFTKRETNPDEIEDDIAQYLQQGAYTWYGYERCRYFGYTGWEYDMLKDYENIDNLSDTLLEGLARASSSLANTYLWYQQGGYALNQDTMQIRLESLQLPSKERVKMVDHYINKSISIYERIKKQNSSYSTIVGNVDLKKFNEAMHGYMQMSIALEKERANGFIKNITLSEAYVKQAKNYLNSCGKDGILFTFGDNDTYQLWYVQEKEGYRKDISVINTSMLGLPAYINMLKINNSVSFNIDPSYYRQKESDIAYFKEAKSPGVTGNKSLTRLINDLQLKKDTIIYTTLDGEVWYLNAYTNKEIDILVNPDNFNKFFSFDIADSSIQFNLKDHLFINDLMMLDIINKNINNRPVYFASSASVFFENKLIQEGIVFRLYPVSKSNAKINLNKEIKLLEKFTDSSYKPVIFLSPDNIEEVYIDGSNSFFQLYAKISEYHIQQNDITNATKWLNKAAIYYKTVTEKTMPAAYSLISPYLKINKDIAKQYAEIFAEYLFLKYRYPSAIKGYLSKKECLGNLEWLSNMLKGENIESKKIQEFISNLKLPPGIESKN